MRMVGRNCQGRCGRRRRGIIPRSLRAAVFQALPPAPAPGQPPRSRPPPAPRSPTPPAPAPPAGSTTSCSPRPRSPRSAQSPASPSDPTEPGSRAGPPRPVTANRPPSRPPPRTRPSDRPGPKQRHHSRIRTRRRLVSSPLVHIPEGAERHLAHGGGQHFRVRYLGQVARRGAMIGNMGSAVGLDAVAGGVAGPGAGGIVSRPRLFERLGAARVTVVSAPAGSGKTVLLRSWISRAGAAGSAAWVTVGRGEQDPQQFWLSVLGALRQTTPGSALVRELTAAPDLDGWAIAERLLKDLAPLEDRIWLLIDDVHELVPAEAQRQLELLVMRVSEELRFVLATRHDVQLSLHRLRLEGELAEIREPDLRFTVAEAEELFDAAGVRLPDPAPLVERTEGWAAGLRLAALSLAGHPDPGRFAEEFSGTERTVSEYLLAEVLDRQPEPVRRLLLRTSVLERVNGELADLLTDDSGGERALQDLEV